jgi:outer membrane protein assembly factor BamB
MVLIGLTALGSAALSGGCGAWGEKKPTTAQGPVAAPAGSFVRSWANDLKLAKDPLVELHLVGDTLYAYTTSHLVYAIDRAGGNTKYLAEPNVSGGVLRAPNRIGAYTVFPSGSTIDLLNDRGRPARTIELEKPIRSAVAVGEGNILYVGLDHYEGAGTAAKIDISEQYKVLKWELMTNAAVTPTPAWHKRILYVGSEDGRIYAVSDERGQMWNLENGKGWFQAGGKFVSDIKVDDFGVYASNTDSKLYCLDPQNGHIKWQYYGSAPLKTEPTVTATMVYQYVPGQGIVAIDKTSGEFNRRPKWTIKDARQVLSEDAENAYLRRRDGKLIAVNKQTGEVAFTSKSSPFEVYVTNETDGTIFGATKDGKVWAVRPVLREGEVGNLVLDFRPEPVAVVR